MSIDQVSPASAVLISVPQDRLLKHSSREVKILQLLITKCLNFRNDKPNILSHVTGYQASKMSSEL